jgi:hypothetical protein
LHPKTVAKWKQRTAVHEAPMGPKQPRSTVLTPEEEALIVACRRPTLLPLEDCLYALQAPLPHRTRSALHRGFTRHGSSRRPDSEGDKPAKQKCNSSPIGSFPLDLAEVRTAEGQLSWFGALDRGCQFASAELHEAARQVVATQLRRHLIAAVP